MEMKEQGREMKMENSDNYQDKYDDDTRSVTCLL